MRLAPTIRKAACHASPTSQRRDAATGYWLVNLLTGRRHLFFTMRKKNMCRCGAKVGAVNAPSGLTSIGWSVRSTRAATRDNCTPCNQRWRASDRQRVLAGSDLGFVGAVITIKVDWAEFGKLLQSEARRNERGKGPPQAVETSGWVAEVARIVCGWTWRTDRREQDHGDLRGQEDLRDEPVEGSRGCAESGLGRSSKHCKSRAR